MLRLSKCLRVSLPFEPMALTTVEALQKRMALYTVHPQASEKEGGQTPFARSIKDTVKAHRVSTSASAAASIALPPSGARKAQAQHDLHWFAGQSPFFISPKFDGIRLISYTAPPLPCPTDVKMMGRWKGRKGPSSAKDGIGSSSSNNNRKNKNLSVQHLFYADAEGVNGRGQAAATTTTFTSCFSRYGRPIYGVFWVEKELALLRFLSKDPYLTLDGEFYIHKGPVSEAAGRKGKGKAIKEKGKKKKTKVEKEEVEQEAGSFKTGFLAVNALVHRLRGSKSACATREDILQYVDRLPSYCVFDIPSYNPPCSTVSSSARRVAPHERGSIEEYLAEVHPRGKQLLAERERIWAAVSKTQHMLDAELLRCTPNVTPFSQRVRTLYFLMDLLAHGVRSPVLRTAFALEDNVAEGGQRAGKHKKGKGSKGKSLGGIFVAPVPYALTTTIEEAKTQLLPAYVKEGYEGAVMRTPMNVYEMREKRKGTVRALCRGLIAQSNDTAAPARSARGVPLEQHLRFTDASLAEAVLEAQEAAAVATVAERRVRDLSPRADTAVKILPFLDQEFAVLRALFKEPSSNPRTRALVTVSASSVGVLAGDIKRESDTEEKKLKNKSRDPTAQTEELVCFYGLQCLSDNGRVFNVTMPKLNASQQKQLLEHILRGGGKRKKSLTGLYATVQFAALTEHGVPRFGQVKAIRGGKGWFL